DDKLWPCSGNHRRPCPPSSLFTAESASLVLIPHTVPHGGGGHGRVPQIDTIVHEWDPHFCYFVGCQERPFATQTTNYNSAVKSKSEGGARLALSDVPEGRRRGPHRTKKPPQRQTPYKHSLLATYRDRFVLCTARGDLPIQPHRLGMANVLQTQTAFSHCMSSHTLPSSISPLLSKRTEYASSRSSLLIYIDTAGSHRSSILQTWAPPPFKVGDYMGYWSATQGQSSLGREEARPQG
ncbi:unnamed protein product, partial [Ectocarpus fasciculatus]